MSWRIPPAWRDRVAAASPPDATLPVPGSARPLGPRLAAVVARLVPGAPLADICADHARLCIAAVHAGRVPRALAIDVAAPPVADARAAVVAAGLGDAVQVERGDGLAPVPDGWGGTVVVAGIGGRLSTRILAAGAVRRVAPSRLIVQANSDEALVRDHLAALGWGIVDEVLTAESGRLFLTVVAEPSAASNVRDAVDRYVGPVLRRRPSPQRAAWLAVQRAWLAPRLAALERAGADEVEATRERLAAIHAVDDATE